MSNKTKHAVTLVEQLHAEVCRLQRRLIGAAPEDEMQERFAALQEITEHLAHAPADTVSEVVLKLEILCVRLHQALQLAYREDAVTYVLAESCHQGLRMLAASGPRSMKRKQ